MVLNASTTGQSRASCCDGGRYQLDRDIRTASQARVLLNPRVRPLGTALPRAYTVASERFLNEILQRIILVGELRVHLLILR